ncbi:hypothetical protein J6590_039180 [Homalodisca vitripennis]|nr:hypothetical protein J6590_039180 [Homalodisca vitripennis]
MLAETQGVEEVQRIVKSANNTFQSKKIQPENKWWRKPRDPPCKNIGIRSAPASVCYKRTGSCRPRRYVHVIGDQEQKQSPQTRHTVTVGVGETENHIDIESKKKQTKTGQPLLTSEGPNGHWVLGLSQHREPPLTGRANWEQEQS